MIGSVVNAPSTNAVGSTAKETIPISVVPADSVISGNSVISVIVNASVDESSISSYEQPDTITAARLSALRLAKRNRLLCLRVIKWDISFDSENGRYSCIAHCRGKTRFDCANSVNVTDLTCNLYRASLQPQTGGVND